jgi:hypothetical protein
MVGNGRTVLELTIIGWSSEVESGANPVAARLASLRGSEATKLPGTVTTLVTAIHLITACQIVYIGVLV